jgi:hypothetical protein
VQINLSVTLDGTGPQPVTADTRDMVAWESYAAKRKLPVRPTEGDAAFPQTTYLCHLAYTACRRAGLTETTFDKFLGDELVDVDVVTEEDTDPTNAGP